MAPVAPPSDQAAESLQKLSLESQAKTIEVPVVSKKLSADCGSYMPNAIQSDPSVTPLFPGFMDPALYYSSNCYPSNPYYYGGFDGNEWTGHTRYMNPEGAEITNGVYGDNGFYQHGYGYNPYGPYSPSMYPVPTVGHDGHLYGSQHYQYLTPKPTSSLPAAPTKTEVADPAGTVQAPFPVDSNNSKTSGIVSGGAKANNVTVSVGPTCQNSSFSVNGMCGSGAFPGWLPSSGYQDPRFHPHVMGLHHPRPMSCMGTAGVYRNRIYPNKPYGQYGNAYRMDGCGWKSVDNKYKPKGRGNELYNYGCENMDGLNELNRGPRIKSSKLSRGFAPVDLDLKPQNISLDGTTGDGTEKLSLMPDREQYNKSDFLVTYSDAKFFVIKSYSEDDVHKSIKYNIWASTLNGNKKLNSAYEDAQRTCASHPVFLFFSVNTSGQFLGVAEMVGPVDFNKSVEYWQQDKWIGCFPVKWHIVKDVPNSLLKHIILENNENKPVTNSRDTQEIKLEQGLQLLKIFRDHASKQCILDDFEFYEDRQQRIQEKKAKQHQFQQQVQVWESKPTEEKNQESKEIINGDVKHSSSDMLSSHLNMEGQTTGNSLHPKSGVVVLDNTTQGTSLQ